MAKKGYARTLVVPEGEKGEGQFVTILLGNIGKDWKPRTTKNGKTVAQSSLAVNIYRNGENVTDWYTIIAWDRDVDILTKYAGKGKQVLLETVGQQRTFQNNKTGQDQTVDEFTVRSFVLLGGEEQGERPASHLQLKTVEELDDEDVPF